MEIALALILHPTRPAVLIARRKKGAHLAGCWEFPGGKVEAGETIAECAVREAMEEVGLAVIPMEEWETTSYAYPERAVVLSPVLCRAKTADAKPLASDEIAWAGPGELANYRFAPANGPIIAALTEFFGRYRP